jgi:uncharacterized protein (TIGR03437 family)
MRLIAFGLILAAPLCASTAGSVPSFTIVTVAGSSAVGDGGPATAAALSDAEGVAVDAAGNIYIADANDHRIRKVATDGTISTVAGGGFPGFMGDGGPASAARLNTPYGIAVDRAGNLYIADLGNNRVRKIGLDGTITTVSGTEKFLAPRNVALDAAGNLYVSEFGGHRVRRVAVIHGTITTIAGTGTAGFSGDGGSAMGAELDYPAGLAFDSVGNLYIADSSNNRVREILVSGMVTTVLGTGDPGATLPNQLNVPTGVAIDSAGNLDVADSGNQRIQQLAPSGGIQTLPGAGRDLAADGKGDLFIAAGSQVLELTPSLKLSTIAGGGSYLFGGDGGPATSARLNSPVAIALDSKGDLYIADQRNSRVRMVDTTGNISTIDGDGTFASGPGELSAPGGVVVNSSGVLYIADQNNDRIEAVLSSGSAVTVAGTGVPGFNADGLPATSTQIFSPGNMAIGPDGTIYFADKGNQRLREIRTDQTISTVAQIAASAVAVDSTGVVYMADADLHEVFRIDRAGHQDIIAGTGVAGFGGDGGPAVAALLNAPAGVAADRQGNVYIADTGNNRIRVITPDGNIRTVAGTGAADFDGDEGPALSAVLDAPTALAIDVAGNIWMADTGNNRVRKLSPAGTAAEVSQQTTSPSVVNAASLVAGPVAPGEIVSIFGLGMGPVTPANGAVDSAGVLPTQLAQTQVLFGGQPAPLFYVQDSEITAQAPYEIAGLKNVDVEIIYQGQSRGKVTVPVAGSAPAIFTVSAGAGLAEAVNQDGTLNSTVDAAPHGSVISLYATGEGVTQPAGVDGQPAASLAPQPVLPTTVSIGGSTAEILYAGETPGFVGLFLVNARVPASLTTTGLVPVVLRVGTVASQAGVTIAVR